MNPIAAAIIAAVVTAMAVISLSRPDDISKMSRAMSAITQARSDQVWSEALASQAQTREEVLTLFLIVLGVIVLGVLLGVGASLVRFTWRGADVLTDKDDGPAPAPPLLPPMVSPVRLIEERSSPYVEQAAWDRLGPGVQLPVGVALESGRRIALPLGGEMGMILIAGAPGYGKSTLLRAMVRGLLDQDANGKRVRLAIVNPKRVDLAMPGNLACLFQSVAVSDEETSRLIGDVRREIDARYLQMEAAAVDVFTALGMPVIVLFIDELALVTDNRSSKQTLADLLYCARVGRAAGIVIVGATQRPSASVLTGDLKALADTRICLPVTTSLESRVVLDADGGELLPKTPGVALYRRGEMLKISCYRTDDFRKYVLGLPRVENTLLREAPGGDLVEGVAVSETREQYIRRLHDEGLSNSEIENKVFGYSGGSAYRMVNLALKEG